jgi:hypothetical protein
MTARAAAQAAVEEVLMVWCELVELMGLVTDVVYCLFRVRFKVATRQKPDVTAYRRSWV